MPPEVTIVTYKAIHKTINNVLKDSCRKQMHSTIVHGICILHLVDTKRGHLFMLGLPHVKTQ